jgi:hypothetical protein
MIDSAIVNMCGGDELRAKYGRLTSMGGSRAANRPLRSLRFTLNPHTAQTRKAGNRLPEIILSKFNNVNYSMEVE